MSDTSKQGQRCEDVIRFKVDRLQCQLQIGHSGEHAAYGVQWSDPQTQPSAPAATELQALRKFKEVVDNSVTVAFLAMQELDEPTSPSEALEHIRLAFKDAEKIFQNTVRESAPAKPSDE